ncbi:MULTISPECIES: AVAST type 1 anti-phage system protein Avs1c [Acinetobacter]|uniref:Uncharacterized protein n=1 Tax=Acinetobacter boissieri TaxID=1219383 RepID=A0A1G6HER1_9GAMM|nr:MULTISPECIES: AVAST type 1 anti-phage system protein Avs1c [Acinetobacter]MCF8999785.1 hypothetical protein [Acinetobacter nectaris]MCF9026701.1 hypothetical protein [Acinetobacter nectaris]SDB92598.1 hypothetical protein SAMN05421733_10597 [Acinetobacter boissieri]
MDFYDTPNTRSEFEHRFHFLFNMINEGKLSGVSIDGLCKVRFLPNGRFDFLSVNESARLQANMMLHMQKMKFPESVVENTVLDKD